MRPDTEIAGQSEGRIAVTFPSLSRSLIRETTKEVMRLTDYEKWIAATRDDSASLRDRQRAFTQLVILFQDMAYASALAQLGDRHLAEDAAQDAFIAAWSSIASLREPSAFPGWLKSIVTRCCLRRGQRGPHSAALWHDVGSDCGDPAVLLARREREREIHDSIGRLPEPERICITLFYIGEYSYQDIAMYLDVPLSTVKKRLFSAKRRLRERMTEMIKDTMQESRPSGSEDFVRRVDFYTAVKSGDVELVARLLDIEPTLWQSFSTVRMGYSSESPLRQAIIDAGLPMVDLLIAHGATIVAGDVEAAAQIGKRDVARRLIDAGAIDGTVVVDQQALVWFRAAHSGDVAIVETLLSTNPALVDSRDNVGRTALMIASAYGDIELVRLLLFHRAVVEATDANGRTAFRHATDHANWCNKGQSEVIEALAAAGADYDIFTVAGAGVLALVQHLVEDDPDIINASNGDGEMTLDCAVAGMASGAGAVIDYLTNKNPIMTIWMAAQFGNGDRARELLESDPSLAQRTRPRDGYCPLHCAARNWRAQELIVPVIELLFAHGADADARTNEAGWTPLHACAEWWNDTQIADALLRGGADINARSTQGWTPLQYALAQGRNEMAAFLRGRGGTE